MEDYTKGEPNSTVKDPKNILSEITIPTQPKYSKWNSTNDKPNYNHHTNTTQIL